MRKKLVLLLSAAAACLLSAGGAAACSCFEPAPPCQAYGAAAAVFVGTPVGVRTKTRAEGEVDWTPRVFRFAVEQAFSGVEGAEVEVATGAGGGDCGYDFRRGQSYLVYAHRGEQGGRLTTGICARTRPAAEAAADLKFLRGLTGRAPGVTISGAVTRERRRVKEGDAQPAGPLADAALVVEGEGVRRELRTDARGRYGLSGLRPGAYKVRLVLPEELTAHLPEREVRVADRGCAEVGFSVADNGRVAGTVTDAGGRPAARVIVALISAEGHDAERSSGRLERTDEDGRYEFAGVPPGAYLLGVRLYGYLEQNDPTAAYQRTYYPGVPDASDAEVINLGPGESLRGRDLPLPPRRAESVLEGRVAWEDGSPVANARVRLREVTYQDRGSSFDLQADGDGHFSVKVYEGLTFAVEGESETPHRTEPGRLVPLERFEPRTVTTAGPATFVTLTIVKLR